MEQKRTSPVESETARNFFDKTGLQVVTTYALGHWVQKRRHKKKRINKKWLKRFGMINVPNGNQVVVDKLHGMVFMHPDTWEKLKKQIETENAEEGKHGELRGDVCQVHA